MRDVVASAAAALLLLALLVPACDRGRGTASPAPVTPATSASSDVNHAIRAVRVVPNTPPEAGHARSNAVADAPVTCTKDKAFPGVWDVPEASAAVEVELRPGDRSLIIFADSGNHGQAMLWPIAPSGLRGPLTLEIGRDASDDIEGAAWAGGHLYTLTSSGAVRSYSPSKTGELAVDQPAYAIGPPPYMCDTLWDGNCGKNYEGLCLRSPARVGREGRSHCLGYVASKAEGTLYCLMLGGHHRDQLTIDRSVPPISLAVPAQALSDCAFGAEGGPAEDTLVVTTNIYGGSTTYTVDEATGALARIDVPGFLNNEAVAIDEDGALYLFMDANTSVSAGSRYTCKGWSARGH